MSVELFLPPHPRTVLFITSRARGWGVLVQKVEVSVALLILKMVPSSAPGEHNQTKLRILTFLRPVLPLAYLYRSTFGTQIKINPPNISVYINQFIGGKSVGPQRSDSHPSAPSPPPAPLVTSTPAGLLDVDMLLQLVIFSF